AYSLKPEILTVITYIDGHLKEELSASQVSALIGYQPKYFSRLFKNEMGCNYSDYVTSRRIGRARELLLETALSVQQIAEMCGFSEVSYFSSRFKQETGMSPKQMRAAL
ncbi:MAG: helix-turn-helix transcriptional regulator, partial [Clostridia bacterium]|nr:helix-turn-helix transcriptional regulator [Clostridia bacterium]